MIRNLDGGSAKGGSTEVMDLNLDDEKLFGLQEALNQFGTKMRRDAALQKAVDVDKVLRLLGIK